MQRNLLLIFLTVIVCVYGFGGAGKKWFSAMTSLETIVDNNAKSFKKAIFPVVAAFSLFNRAALADLKSSPWSDQIQYEVVKENPSGAVPKVGDLIAVRFTASFKGTVIDDTFKTDEPFYFRCGVGNVVKGMDETVIHMHEGDRVRIQVGGDYAFGSKGLPAAPGRPRIPPNAVVDYDIQLVQVPGTGDEIIVDDI